MKKIASPQELSAELQRLLAYAGSEKPSREKLANELRGLAERVAAQPKESSIKEITKAYIRTYRDSGQEKAYVEWVDQRGKKGRTEGDPKNAHMKALLDRAKHEGIKVEHEKW